MLSTSSGIFCEPLSGAAVGGGVAVGPSGWSGSVIGGDAFSMLKNGGLSSAAGTVSPTHVTLKGGSMTLAAHAAAAVRGQ